ncbi:hypothetical protein F2Q68_00030088, partial [Brassica cretica]
FQIRMELGKEIGRGHFDYGCSPKLKKERFMLQLALDERHGVRYEDGYTRGSDARIEWERREDFCFFSFEGNEGHEVRYEDGYMRGSDARIEWERREDFCFCSFEGSNVFLTLSPTLNEAACYNLGYVALGSLIVFFVESVQFILEAIHRRTKLSGTTPDHCLRKSVASTSIFDSGTLAQMGCSSVAQKYMVIEGEPNAFIRMKKFILEAIHRRTKLSGTTPDHCLRKSVASTSIFDSGTLAQMGCSSVAQKYMVIEGEPNAFIRMKKGAGGVTIKTTTQALVFFMSTNDLDQCNIVVERFDDYLIDTWL